MRTSRGVLALTPGITYRPGRSGRGSLRRNLHVSGGVFQSSSELLSMLSRRKQHTVQYMHACSELASVRKARSPGETSTPRSSVSALASKHTLQSRGARYGSLCPGYAASSRGTDKDHRYDPKLALARAPTTSARTCYSSCLHARVG